MSTIARRPVATWLWTGAALTFAILVIGGITRLTQSGLSMVEWQPIIGIVPPLTEAQWIEEFERYRQFPEYQVLRRGMTLSEFKFIFFWEYLHRVVARLIGIVFLVPFLYFLVRGWLDRQMKRRALVLFALGGLQGFMGWYMVSSGLVDRPHVSHYRLAVHLAIAFAIFGCCVWYALDLRRRRSAPAVPAGARRSATVGLAVVGGLLAVQIFWGALVAGLKAGLYSNTFPLMGGAWIPEFAWGMDPLVRNFVENPLTVHWLHRVIGTVLALAAIAFVVRHRGDRMPDREARVLSLAMVAVLLGQYLLGVLTVLFHVPVSLGVAHQAVAMILFGIWLALLHRVRGWSEVAPRQPGRRDPERERVGADRLEIPGSGAAERAEHAAIVRG
jgi:heme a synthase